MYRPSYVLPQVIRGQYDPLPESYSPALRAVVTSMLSKDVKARPDANQLLGVPAVVPHVQVGRATKRMLSITCCIRTLLSSERCSRLQSTGGGQWSARAAVRSGPRRAPLPQHTWPLRLLSPKLLPRSLRQRRIIPSRGKPLQAIARH